MVDLFDNAVSISGVRRTNDGYLVADVRVARTGVQDYLGSEVDPDGSLGLRDMQIVRVYRPEEEVFSDESMRSYAYRPVTNDHPRESVNSLNWKQLAVGQTDGKVVRDGEWVQVPMVLMDADMIAKVEGGKRQLSMGYKCILDATSGVTPDGIHYDAVQRNLRMNHLAVVSAARAGPDARIGDNGDGTAPKGATVEDRRMTVQTQKVVVDGLTIETTDQGAQVIVKLQKQLLDSENNFKKMKEEEETKNKAKDAELAKKDAQIDDLKAKVLSGDALDTAVAARADLLDAAKRIAPKLEVKGLSDAAIKKAVVVASVGDSMKDKSESYIDARFDMLAESVRTTSDAQTQLRHVLSNTAVVGDDAQKYQDAVSKSAADLNKHRTQ